MECGGQSCEAHGQACSGSCSCTLPPQLEPPSPTRICRKCKERGAQVLANQTEAICGSCLNAALLSKFKTAINNNELIVPTDKVLLAFSGGPASRVALEFLIEIRQKAQRDAVNCKDGNALVFGLGVAHVDEGSVLPISSSDRERAVEEMKSVVMNGNRMPDEFLIVPLETIYTSDEAEVLGEKDGQDGRLRKLQLLMQSVKDATGKEDLLEHLRMQVLQQVAEDHGYTKLVLGLCTSRIAAKVIAATTKGCGFSLPAEMQYSDARWKVPVVLPLRDCVVKELVLLCHLNHLKTVFIRTFSTLVMPQHSINSLSAAFVSLLQEENPSRERTIVRTAAKLKPFHFNHLPSGTSCSSRRRSSSLQSLNANFSPGERTSELLCPVCFAPLNEKEILGVQSDAKVYEPHSRKIGKSVSGNNGSESSSVGSAAVLPVSVFTKMCCPNCQFQILEGKEGSKMHELLPHMIKRRGLENLKDRESWMRSQIDEYLISDEIVDSDE